MYYYTYDFQKLVQFLILGWAIFRLIRTLRHGKPDLGRAVLIWGLFFFLLFLLHKTFAPFTFISDFSNLKANFTPLKGILSMIENASKFDDRTTQRIVFINIVGNILIFSPFGFLFPVLEKRLRNFFLVTMLGLGMSLAIELTQTFLAARVFDVDDLIMNAFGTLIGYWVFWLLYQIKPIQQKFDRIAEAVRPGSLLFSLGYLALVLITAGLIFHFDYSAFKLIPH